MELLKVPKYLPFLKEFPDYYVFDEFIDNPENTTTISKMFTKTINDNLTNDIGKEIISKYLKPYVDYNLTDEINIDFDNDLVIHIHSGDCFIKTSRVNENFNHKLFRCFMQPPYSFYKHVIDSTSYSKVWIIAEDTENPNINKLLKNYPTLVKYLSNDAVTDFKILLHAKNLAIGTSDFSKSALFLSNVEKNIIYATRTVQWCDTSKIKPYKCNDYYVTPIEAFDDYIHLLLNYSRKKYLLCLPFSGLNDMLCQMYDCYLYCRKYNRTLLIDTNFSWLATSFNKYFEINNDTDVEIILDTNIIKEVFNSYDTSYETNTSYSNDLAIDYNEDIIIYRKIGYGTGSLNFIKFFRLKGDIINEFELRYKTIHQPYVTTHFRHTDHTIRNDYIEFYNSHKSIIDESNFFLATDSIEVLKYFKSLNIKLYSFIKCISEETKDNHYHGIHYSSFTNKHEVMIDTICDLLLMALAEEFILPQQIIGGFTRLAQGLHQNKDIVWKMLRK